MENKNVGWLILGIAVLMILIVFIFNSALKDIVNASCSAVGHGDNCPMIDTITRQTYLSLSIVGVLVILGLFMLFSKPNERVVFKKIKERVEVKNKPVDYGKLNNEEKVLAKIIESSNGGLFQSDLVEKSGFGKVKVTRILDKLEGKQLIERKRRGLNNFIMFR